MDEELLLTILKWDLKAPPSEKPYLRILLRDAEALMERMRVQDDGSMDYQYTIERYVAFLYHKRASSEMTMPRFLRCELNNLLSSRKARE